MCSNGPHKQVPYIPYILYPFLAYTPLPFLAAILFDMPSLLVLVLLLPHKYVTVIMTAAVVHHPNKVMLVTVFLILQ